MKTREVEGRAVAYARGGDAIVETALGRVYVPDAVPGDEVRLTPPARVRGALHARVREVAVPSEERVTPPCVLAAACGGCAFMVASIALQRETKRAHVAQALSHDVRIAAAGADLGYRRRARLAFDARAKRVGYRGLRSSTIVDVARCEVLAAPLAAALDAVRTTLLPILDGQGELRLAIGLDDRPVLRITSGTPQRAALYLALEALVRAERIAGASVLVAGISKPALIGDPRERTRAFDGSTLLGTDGGFSQANLEVNAELVSLVRGFARTDGATVLELYAGHGNLTVALAAGTKRYTAVELDLPAAEALVENTKARGLDVRVLARDVAKAPTAKVDVVVLDPPRTGAAEAIAGIVAAAPSRIVYVSCDPGTLGRDVKALIGHGYALREAVALDMFPHTPHVETVAWLERT